MTLERARNALANTGSDPSNGAYWWDGADFKGANHPKRRNGFRYGDPAHNIFDVDSVSKPVTLYWQKRDKNTGKLVNTKVCGRYEYVWRSTAAHAGTIFWAYDEAYLAATGGSAHK